MSLGKGFASKMRRFSESDVFRGLGRHKSGSDPHLELIDEVEDNNIPTEYRIASLQRRPSEMPATKTKWYSDRKCQLLKVHQNRLD